MPKHLANWFMFLTSQVCAAASAGADGCSLEQSGGTCASTHGLSLLAVKTRVIRDADAEVKVRQVDDSSEHAAIPTSFGSMEHLVLHKVDEAQAKNTTAAYQVPDRSLMAMRQESQESTHAKVEQRPITSDSTLSWEVWGSGDSSMALIESSNTTAPHHALTQEDEHREGIMYIVVTGLPSLKKALLAQETWMTRLRQQDRAVHVCAESCARAAGDTSLRDRGRRQLRSVLQMPDGLLANCTRRENGEPCNGYHKANLKFPFGLVHTYHRLVAKNERLPQWWVLKDDDVYVDVKNFTLHLASHDATQPLILAPLAPECPGVCGSGSVVLSWQLAERMARVGEEWLAGMKGDIATANFYWDQQLPSYARRFFPSVAIVDDPYLEPYGPFDRECTGQASCGEVFHLNRPFRQGGLCKCTSSESPATWHVKTDFERALALVDARRGVPDLHQQ